MKTRMSICLVALILSAGPARAGDLKVMNMGLGSGTVTTPTGINCTSLGATLVNCESSGLTGTVRLTAAPDADSDFGGWDTDPNGEIPSTADCLGIGFTCDVDMTVNRSVRPVFNLKPAVVPIPALTTATLSDPDALNTYLLNNPQVNTPARFLQALPDDFKRNWILMSRSESLQTGTAQFPRILMPSADSQFTFSFGLSEHESYPGANPNAIEFMQWDPIRKNFRLHEIVLATIPPMATGAVPMRNRQVYKDNARCTKCHSTQNIPNSSAFPGTANNPSPLVIAKNKPNWDTYDSWGGMMPFNRDRIYQGSIEAAEFRRLLNPWTWRFNDVVRPLMEQLRLQPAAIDPAKDGVVRTRGGAGDGQIKFRFDGGSVPSQEPPPSGPGPNIQTNYSFDGAAGTGTRTQVVRGGQYITLRHEGTITNFDDEGRGVRFFDNSSRLNHTRIADELINHSFATSSQPVDVRPIVLAITTPGCFEISGTVVRSTSPTALSSMTFFDDRNGATVDQILADTLARKRYLPVRKVDIEKRNLDRSVDPYLATSVGGAAPGLLLQNGVAPAGVTLERIRQEVFRRPIDRPSADSSGVLLDASAQAIYVDREQYGVGDEQKVAMFRYFLEPLGVSVDKWSLGVRGRSRTYTFADVFGGYVNDLQGMMASSLDGRAFPGLARSGTPPLYSCNDLTVAVKSIIAGLPAASQVPRYTDVQRIFNKACIECHGGLHYPPYNNFGTFLDLSEKEDPPLGDDRMIDAWRKASSLAGSIADYISRPAQACPPGAMDMMPCGGPRLNQTDIKTINRWIAGPTAKAYTIGDPHLTTIEGVPYDFQGAGEYVLLKGEGFEVQARQTAVETNAPLGPNGHTGLTSCVSINTAVAVRVGSHRVTYEPNVNGKPDPSGLELRVDGKLRKLERELLLSTGGRILQTSAAGGIQIEGPDGSIVVVTPGWWDYYKVWYLNVEARRAHAADGLMGEIPAGGWLPSLPDGTPMGPRPADLSQRYKDLYGRFGDAWRVTDATSLFDYVPGTSTGSYSIPIWPLGESPRACIIPRELVEFVNKLPGKGTKPPLPVLTLGEAEKHCRDVVGPEFKANCIQDVRVTGEPAFASTYVLTEKLSRNRPPTSAGLVSPEDHAENLSTPVTFTWSGASDPEGGPVTYRYCVWSVDTGYTFNDCEIISDRTLFSSGGGGLYCALWVLLIGGLLLVLIFFFGKTGNKRQLLITVAVATVIAAILALFLCGSRTYSKTISKLEPGKSYFWKVIAEDGNGGSSESKTWRIKIK